MMYIGTINTTYLVIKFVLKLRKISYAEFIAKVVKLEISVLSVVCLILVKTIGTTLKYIDCW